MSISFTIQKQTQGTKLVDFLRNELNCSARKAKGLLDRRVVLVNSKRIWMAKHALKAGDIVQVLEILDETPSKLDVLFEDDYVLILNKPSGIISNGRNSLETQLQKNFPEARVAHRLDTDTSGCLLCSKNVQVFEAIKEVFKQGVVEKKYLAIVYGNVTRSKQTINNRLDGQTAITHVTVTKSTNQCSLLDITIETGRTHQIRRHLQSIGHPVIGDKQYVLKRYRSSMVAASRQLLHAAYLSLPHPALPGQKLKATAPTPEDFRSWSKKLGL